MHIYLRVRLHHCLHLFCCTCTKVHIEDRHCSICDPSLRIPTGYSWLKMYPLIEALWVLSNTKSFTPTRLNLVRLSYIKNRLSHWIYGDIYTSIDPTRSCFVRWSIASRPFHGMVRKVWQRDTTIATSWQSKMLAWEEKPTSTSTLSPIWTLR